MHDEGGTAVSVGAFSEVARASGYLDEQSMLALLDRAEGREAVPGLMERLALGVGHAFASGGWLWGSILILTGGLLLNLTPCVLPMIPVNMAILGAGAQAGSRMRGFLLGLVYGSGMALVYGVLGVVAVLTSSRFGSLNANPWFNLVIAVIFLLLAVSMFGFFNIDLSRFQSGSGHKNGVRSTWPAAFSMGAIAALLAGACVAPVLIAVLLLAGKLYSAGHSMALLLPFLLGAGMALPWPLVGAGLSLLPRPGGWMNYVKYGFGVLIAALALYYAREAYDGFSGKEGHAGEADYHLSASSPDSLWDEIFSQAREQEKLVFVDFWASWCKNCLTMEKTTFQSAEVKTRLDAYITVKYQAEKPNENPAKEVLDRFGVVGGLPTYIIVRVP